LVLLLHGWGDNIKSLAHLQQTLAAHYQVLALDLPGFGGTDMPPESWDLDNYAHFVRAALEKLELGQPYAVIGHSNGGALAIRALSLKTLRPDKLVLLAASGVRTNQRGKRLLLKIIAKTGDVATLWLPERYRQALRKRLYGAAGSDLLAAPHLEETFKRTVRQDVQADAAVLDLPTLLVYAADDDAVPLADGRQYQELIKDSRLEVIQAAGHFVHLDQPAQVEALIEEFLV
jgi:pimeloyl-ACP methyl ester carboxylesterase